MASHSSSTDVNDHSAGDLEHSGGTSRPPLPRPDNGDNVCPVPLWEIEFCRNAYDIPWETFCENKRFIGLYRNVLDWDDSGAFKNFLDAKERFRAKYHGEPYEDAVLDPDMYIDEVYQPYCICTANNSNYNFLGGGPSYSLHQQGVDPVHMSSGTARMLPSRMWVGGTIGGGARNLNGGGGSGNGSRKNLNGGSGGGSGGDNGSGRKRNGGGCGGSSGSSWNCFSRCNRKNQAEGQHQQRNGGGMQRNQNEGQHQQRSGGRQQQGQRGMKMEGRPVAGAAQQGSQR